MGNQTAAWMREEIEDTFEIFVEQKWLDALNVATAEPFVWEMTGAKTDKPAKEKATVAQKKVGRFHT
jgi:hypothetical protein